MWSCVGLRYLRYKGWGWVGRVPLFVRIDDEGLLCIVLRPRITHDYGWLRRVVHYRRARSRYICRRRQLEHATVREVKTPITGKVYLQISSSPKVHSKWSPTLCHACVSCILAGNTPQLRFHLPGPSEADCCEVCSPEVRDDPTLWGLDDGGNEFFLWNSSMTKSSSS